MSPCWHSTSMYFSLNLNLFCILKNHTPVLRLKFKEKLRPSKSCRSPLVYHYSCSTSQPAYSPPHTYKLADMCDFKLMQQAGLSQLYCQKWRLPRLNLGSSLEVDVTIGVGVAIIVYAVVCIVLRVVDLILSKDAALCL